MMLQSTKFLSDNGADAILLTKSEDYDFPIGIAISTRLRWRSSNTQSNFKIVETLLKFERCQSCITSVEDHPDPAAEPFISKQWSLSCNGARARSSFSSQPALHLAAYSFGENQMCHLLDVA